ncbi:MAG: valine--tRNA ligase [Patescibacteria group bacterium]
MNEIPEIFLKPYNPGTTEDRIYTLWEKSGYFNPDLLPARYADAEPFSIVLPPPNVTGTLHAGHALTVTIEDIMVRYARMQGKKTLWLPGTDHAAIATQSKVEKDIEKKEGKRRRDFTREEFLRRVEDYASESHTVITKQLRSFGASVDWSREAFTLDAPRTLAVRTVFKKMYDEGLIYRGYRVINWDPKGQTTISDDEIVYETRKTKLYTFAYSADIPILISTTRPETKLGDTAIAVHPDDARYAAYIGQEFTAVFAGEAISLKVIADQSVDPAFGTGALGVTPAHSSIDWDMSQRHGLPLKQVINEFGKMTVGMEGVKDKKVAEAREAVVAWLKEQGLMHKEEDIEHNISLAERTGGVIEPLPKLQWFVAVNKEFTRDGTTHTLKELMQIAVSSGAISMIPPQFEKVYFHWIENLRDWCISRQIWYGHRVPVWYRKNLNLKNEISKKENEIETYVGTEAPTGEGWTQDEDTLDTWFSSGLWTFSTLGWPDEAEFAKHRIYHPTAILETGRDILFFWIARMILMSTYILGEVPFRQVYLHGLVLDNQGRKMSKSLGNFIDPLEVIAKYGADAYRMALVVGVGPGSDSKLGEDKIKAYKLFSNKLWNITRFVLENTSGQSHDASFTAYSESDKKLITERDALVTEITREMNEYKFYLVAEKLYHYVWSRFAADIVEESKTIFREGTDADKASRTQFLRGTLNIILKVLHPFMPYITEEIWQVTHADGSVLMVEKWPA